MSDCVPGCWRQPIHRYGYDYGIESVSSKYGIDLIVNLRLYQDLIRKSVGKELTTNSKETKSFYSLNIPMSTNCSLIPSFSINNKYLDPIQAPNSNNH